MTYIVYYQHYYSFMKDMPYKTKWLRTATFKTYNDASKFLVLKRAKTKNCVYKIVKGEE